MPPSKIAERIEMSKKAGGTRKRRSTRPAKRSAGAAGAQLVPESQDELIVRMYRQGLGDCFLLALPAGTGKAKYVLVDCGIHMRQTDGPTRLAEVMQHLAAATGDRIDVVVATHEHADHLSGFVQKGSPFLKDDLTVEELWVAWTEKRGDGQADKLRKQRGTAQRIIDKAVDEARTRAGAEGPAIADELMALTDFNRPPDNSVDLAAVIKTMETLRSKAPLLTAVDQLSSVDEEPVFGLAKKAKKRDTASVNELALGLLALKAGDNHVKYCEPGEVCEVAGVAKLRAYVLGPPRSDLLEKEKPSKIRGATEDDPGGMYKEVYLTATRLNRALELSPRFMLGLSANGGDLPSSWRHPFPEQFGRVCEFSKPLGSGKRGCWSAAPPPPAGTRAFVERTYFDPRAAWRRIDADWLQSVDILALNLESDTNNTSLALAFEWGEPGDGKVLLFAADAQVGNWLSWRDQKYGPKKHTADELLSRVLLYKVGHHGSHNSTVRRDPRDLSSPDPIGAPFGLELMNDIIAMIPVDHDAVKKKMPDPWKMPHEPLYRRLREKARRRVMRSDLELMPLDDSRDERDLVPPSEKWTPVPGVTGARWRRSKETFTKGTKGPLCYDIAISRGR
jgi:hypothetical protein